MKLKKMLLVASVLAGIAAPAMAQEKYTVGYDNYFNGNSWSVQLSREFEAEAERNADTVDVIYTESEMKADRQVSNIEDMITRGVDAIVFTPISPTAVIPVLKKAEAQGIKIVLLASTIRSDDYDALVTVDDVDFGKAGAEWLAEKLGGEGRIIALNGISGISASDDRWEGAEAVFDAYPGIEVISVVDAGWDYAKAKVAVSNLLAANPEVDGVWSQGGSMTLGAIDAFDAAQRPLVPMTGEDNNGYLKRWAALESDGYESVAPSKPTWLGSEALLVAIDLLEGEEVEKDKVYEVPMITSENLSEFTRDDLSDSFWANTRLSDEQIRATFED
ncbi:ABC transporter substrate-binding protein [Martelella radicis]|uniref:Ribose transport system substrate-binding protein n=1 Tax=Martelella radicis TaxID=1397476 RepID=A0A7W6PBP0_9HYPH|nr:ABC transporter substrate-binding protein [Martelella radicis]MBB4122607.1 ribose transport system substrate-binding protein [Martelella radicis]